MVNKFKKIQIIEKFKPLKNGIKQGAKKMVENSRESANLDYATYDDDDLITALDIGTEYIKVLIARVVNREKLEDDEQKIDLEIISTSRVKQPINNMHAGAIADISGVIETCEKALTIAENSARVSAGKVVLGIAGELVLGISHNIVYKRETPEEPISAEEVWAVVEKAQERSEIKAKKILNIETGDEGISIKLVNSSIINMFIDGYRVTNPVGFQGSRMKLQLYSAFAPMVHIAALERVAKELNLELVAIAAEPFAVARGAVGPTSENPFSAILVDIGGGTTDIAIVDEGGVQGTKSYAIGGRSFTKSLADGLGMSMTDAEELKVTLGADHIEKNIKYDAIKILNKTAEVWLSGLELTLDEFAGELQNMGMSLPPRIMICGGGASLGAISTVLKDPDWYRELPFTKAPIVKALKPEDMIGIFDKTGKVTDHTRITVMGLLRVGVDSLATNDNNEDESNEAQLTKSVKNLLRK